MPKIGSQIQGSLIILVSGGNLVPKTGTKNGAQKWCPKLGTKMVTKCSPPAKKRPTNRRRNCKNHCTKLGPKTIAKTRIKFCAQNDSLTVAGYCNSGLASGSVWRRVGTVLGGVCCVSWLYVCRAGGEMVACLCCQFGARLRVFSGYLQYLFLVSNFLVRFFSKFD